jgi:hypothetical protein
MQESERANNPKIALPGRLKLETIGCTLQEVEDNWTTIESALSKAGVGKRDVPFNSWIRENMMSAYTYLDQLLEKGVEPFSVESLGYMLGLSSRVLYGQDQALREEYSGALEANSQKFYAQIEPMINWYQKHKGENKLRKLAGEIYVSVLGPPQLFIEGNHRTGSLIANWINVFHGYPPFVLSPENAVAFFLPSSEIKQFVNKATWRGRNKLPKYRKSFGGLWETLATNRAYLQS